MKQFWRMILVISLQFLAVAIEGSHHSNAALSFEYYVNSCPQVEQIVHNKIMKWIKKDRTLAPALIRLHFHDCAVRGCDGSILLNHAGSERKANASMSLRGFEAINDIKLEVEKKCPKTVSCADILTVAARDATLAVGGPFWMVPFGRKDGRVSLAKEADHTVPIGRESVTRLINFFQSKGLDVVDLVVLSGIYYKTIRIKHLPLRQKLPSIFERQGVGFDHFIGLHPTILPPNTCGNLNCTVFAEIVNAQFYFLIDCHHIFERQCAGLDLFTGLRPTILLPAHVVVLTAQFLLGAHTIGRTTCESLQFRLSNYNGTRKPDPTINRHYRNLLRRKCKRASDYVNLDGVTPNTFDVQYYTNLEKKMGVLLTDQLLYSDRRTEPLVAVLASQPSVFEPQFAASMVKLGNIMDHFNNGEVRLNCERINTY